MIDKREIRAERTIKEAPLVFAMTQQRMIRMIWDFHGEDARSKAKHHEKHLVQFGNARELEFEAGCEERGEQHWIAWIAVEEGRMIEVRDALYPHRAELHEE